VSIERGLNLFLGFGKVGGKRFESCVAPFTHGEQWIAGMDYV